jgi:endonuclease-8
VTRSVAEALLDQSAVAGIGNVVRSEVLHVAGVDPWLPVGDVPAAELQAILGTAADLLRANVGGGARVTTASQARGPLDRSMTRQRLWVYGRAGRPCRRCGTLIRVGRIGALSRSIYWCPTCQAAGPGAGAGVT